MNMARPAFVWNCLFPRRTRSFNAPVTWASHASAWSRLEQVIVCAGQSSWSKHRFCKRPRLTSYIDSNMIVSNVSSVVALCVCKVSLVSRKAETYLLVASLSTLGSCLVSRTESNPTAVMTSESMLSSPDRSARRSTKSRSVVEIKCW